MKKPAALVILASLLACAAALASAAAGTSENQAFLGRARQSYYSLRDQGLQALKCEVLPNWQLELQGAPDADAKLRIFSQVRFTLSLGADGTVTVAHSDPPANSGLPAPQIQRVSDLIGQTIDSLFRIWKTFMLHPFLPRAGTEFRLETLGSQYRLSYDEDRTTHVVTILGPDLGIVRIDETTPDSTGSTLPRFNHSPQGYILTGYDVYQQTGRPEEATQVRVDVAYQQVSGLQLVRAERKGQQWQSADCGRVRFPQLRSDEAEMKSPVFSCHSPPETRRQVMAGGTMKFYGLA